MGAKPDEDHGLQGRPPSSPLCVISAGNSQDHNLSEFTSNFPKP